MSGWAKGYSFRCQPVDYSNNAMALRMANTCWWYYISKFTEFFDTVSTYIYTYTSFQSLLDSFFHSSKYFIVV